MSNLEPIIPNIILEENDTLAHINLAIVISKGKLSISRLEKCNSHFTGNRDAPLNDDNDSFHPCF